MQEERAMSGVSARLHDIYPEAPPQWNTSLFVAVTVCGAVPHATVPACRLSLKALWLEEIGTLSAVNHDMHDTPIDNRSVIMNSTAKPMVKGIITTWMKGRYP